MLFFSLTFFPDEWEARQDRAARDADIDIDEDFGGGFDGFDGYDHDGCFVEDAEE